MFINNQDVENNMLQNIENMLKYCHIFYVATAYISEGAIIRLMPSFMKFISNSGQAEIYIGRAMVEGLNKNTLEACCKLDILLKNNEGGVYAVNSPFHSKIYVGKNVKSSTAWIGSSNLTLNGLYYWREANFKINSDNLYIEEILKEIDYISNDKISLEEIKIVERIKPHEIVREEIFEHYTEIDSPITKKLKLPLYSRQLNEVQFGSGLNWWNGGGRPRNPNEACIALSISDIEKNPDFFPDRANQGAIFTVYTDDGVKMKMQIEGGGPIDNVTGIRYGKQIASKPHKAQFGEWILRNKLKLEEGTLVTREILKQYGKEEIEFLKINNKEYIMKY